MLDVVKEVTIVPLPVSFAMVADRAEVALTRLEKGIELTPRDRRGLKNAIDLLDQAAKGKRIRESTTRTSYEPEALQAYQLLATASSKANVKGSDFLNRFRTVIDSFLSNESKIPDLSALRTFFHELAEWCLRQDEPDHERVDMRLSP